LNDAETSLFNVTEILSDLQWHNRKHILISFLK
jgi:hypothetical protein